MLLADRVSAVRQNNKSAPIRNSKGREGSPLIDYSRATKFYNVVIGCGVSSHALSERIGFCDITIAAESANAIAVTFQLRKLNAHEALDGPKVVTLYQYEDTSGTMDTGIDSNGDPTYVMTIGTGVVQSAFNDGLELAVRSSDTGAIVVTLTDSSASGTDTKYIGLACGEFFCQTGAITFA